MAHYESKHGIVSKGQAELYMGFVDMRNLTGMLPDNYRNSVTADFDSLSATVQGFTLEVRVDERRPYDRIRIVSSSSPVEFCILIHFDDAGLGKTDFHLELDANLNLMMKTMLGGKIRQGLDGIVDALVAVSEGRMPEGMPSAFKPEDFR